MSTDALCGIIGTLLGTVLGWALNMLTNSLGKIHISYDVCFCSFEIWSKTKTVFFYENPEYAKLDLELNVTNSKNRTIGLSECKILIEYGNRIAEFADLDMPGMESVEEVGDNLESLMNIPAYYTRKIYFKHKSSFLTESEKLKDGYKIVLRYRVNGQKRVHKTTIFKQGPYRPK